MPCVIQRGIRGMHFGLHHNITYIKKKNISTTQILYTCAMTNWQKYYLQCLGNIFTKLEPHSTKSLPPQPQTTQGSRNAHHTCIWQGRTVTKQ